MRARGELKKWREEDAALAMRVESARTGCLAWGTYALADSTATTLNLLAVDALASLALLVLFLRIQYN